MSNRILFVSQYASEIVVGSNNNVFRQAKALKQYLGVEVDILTWPAGDGWTGPMPTTGQSAKFSYHDCSEGGLNYHLVNLSTKLLERVLSDSDWQNAVEVGCEILKKINPSIVHLQHWRGLWWILESANRLSIPTVYSPHDWGIGCLRTILVKGDGSLCDGVVGIDKCIECIWKGRNPIGKVNELLVSTALGENLFEIFDHASVGRWLTRQGAVRLGLRKRVTLNYHRTKDVLSKLSALVVPNCFAKEFYQQFNVPGNRIYVEPWYYDLTARIVSRPIDREKNVFGYIGRISPEKGVSRIFEALSKEDFPMPIHLVIAGAIQGKYAENLHSKYQSSVGIHSVEWMGWIPHEEVHKFYEKVDTVIISSEWIENGPLTLIESFAFKRNVIITDTPTARDLVKEGYTGFLTAIHSTHSLGQTIRKVSLLEPKYSLEMKNNIPPIKSSGAYARDLKDIYDSVYRELMIQ